MGSQSYQDLKVWKKSIELCLCIYHIKFPRSESYGIANQMKRASVSIASNIAEGQARQRSKEFLHFLSIANGSLAIRNNLDLGGYPLRSRTNSQNECTENQSHKPPREINGEITIDTEITEINEESVTFRLFRHFRRSRIRSSFSIC